MIHDVDIEKLCEDVYSMHCSLDINVNSCIKRALKNNSLDVSVFNVRMLTKKYRLIRRKKRSSCSMCGNEFFILNNYRGMLLCRECFMNADGCDEGAVIHGYQYGSPGKMAIEE